ncbi:MAG TPA: serine/threonine-protein kinase [Planctomycetota bacterium]|nr:serine/threonine-protein kinase [Planctomycetota bacterium]
MATRLEESFLSKLPKHEGSPFLSLGHIVIESQCFENPLGGLFLARHTNLQIPVSLRVMHSSVRAQLKNADRFLAESRRLAMIRHPNLAGVLDVGEFDGHAYMVTEYVCGVPLEERLKERPLPQAQALSLLVPIAEGLCELWRGGFVHRSVAPPSVFIQKDGKAKLEYSVLRRNYTDPQFKAHLAPIIAPYWSPEELRDQPVDPSSDMWSFGATLYHAVTGQPPFGHNVQNVYASVLYGEPTDPRKLVPGMHPALAEVLLKLLTRVPEDRFLSAEAFIGSLRGAMEKVIGTPLQAKTIMFSELPAPDAGNAQKRPAVPLSVGSSVGNCKLVKKAGAGAFGVVYLARHKILDIDVAIKVLPTDIAEREPSYVEMFLREARTAARIRHPNVISIYEAGDQDGQYYIIMEYVPNGNVAERMLLNGGKLPPREVARILLGAARGLAAAERFNIIHRDIKPENLMFGDDDEVKIADLGLAKRLPVKGSGTVRGSLVLDQITMKNDPEGLIIGTPSYMAPEAAVTPNGVDVRADLYALGVTAFQMVCGKLPFEGDGSMAVIMKHITEPAPSLRALEPSAPKELTDIIDRLLKKDPGERYQKPGDLVAALETLVSHPVLVQGNPSR